MKAERRHLACKWSAGILPAKTESHITQLPFFHFMQAGCLRSIFPSLKPFNYNQVNKKRCLRAPFFVTGHMSIVTGHWKSIYQIDFEI
jgi:hypothetical protein